jgi:predicted PurR-regulated permease PerM
VSPEAAAAPEQPRTRWFPPPPTIVWAIAIAIVAAVAYIASDVVVLVIFSAALAYVISPLVRRLEAAAIRHNLAVTGVYVTIFLVFTVTAALVIPRLRTEIVTLSSGTFKQQVDQSVDKLHRELIDEYPSLEQVLGDPESRNERLSTVFQQQTANLPNLLSHAVEIAIVIVLIPVFSYFFLRDSRRLLQLLMDRLPADEIETSVAVWCEIERIIGRYLRGLALEAMVIATIASTGLWLLGVNYPLFLGVFSGMANVIPYVGPFLSGTVVAMIAMIQFQSFAPLVKVMLLYLLIKFCDLTIIQTLTVGRSVHLHPILLVGSLLIGGHAFGLIGMVVVVPIVTALQEVTRLLLDHRRRKAGIRTPRHAPSTPIQNCVC